MERQKYSITIETLPTEVLLHVLSFLGIPDLVQLLSVSHHLRRIVQGSRGDRFNILWAKASTEGIQVDNKTIKYLTKAAHFGNKEALIKLIVAHLYSQGVPEGSGKGTEQAENGIKAAKLLILLETLPCSWKPFSWVLVRPPFSRNFICCKACVYNQIKHFCNKSDKNTECPDLFYVIGKAISFHEDSSERNTSLLYYKTGSEMGSSCCSYEYWKAIHTSSKTHAPSSNSIDVSAIRALRLIASESTTIIDARFELCRQYAMGNYGGLSRSIALSYITQTMLTSPPLISDKVFKIQHRVNRYMMMVLFDWIVEVAEMKCFMSCTIHMALQLIQRYLLKRSLSRSRIQLMGITALLLAARWCEYTILTVREASSITDDTYTYHEVVDMMSDLAAALEGDLIHPLPTDYLEILIQFTSSDERTNHLASYIAESCVVHLEVGGLSTAHFSSACFLLSRILLYQEFPWSSDLVEITGLKLHDLKDTVLLLYRKCFAEEFVFDYRGEKLDAIHAKYASGVFNKVSEIQVMSLSELKDCLGVAPPPSSLEPRPRKLFSFLSDSQYRSSDDDSLVDQSFIQDFNSHFITEPSPTKPATTECEPVRTTQHHQSSPLPNIGPSLSFNFPPLLPYPCVENRSISPPISSMAHSSCNNLATHSSSGSSSSISSDSSGLSPSTLPSSIPCIAPLHPKENDSLTTKQNSMRKKKVKKQSNSNKENIRILNSKTCKLRVDGQQVNRSGVGGEGQPLGKLNCNGRSLDENKLYYSKSKRKRRRSS